MRVADFPGRNLLVNGDFCIHQRWDSSVDVDHAGGYFASYVEGWWTGMAPYYNQALGLVTENVDRHMAGLRSRLLDVGGYPGKHGHIQFLPAEDVPPEGTTLTLSAKLNAGSGGNDIRLAILAWTGEVGAYRARRPFSSWEGGTTNNPVPASGWTYLNSPASLSLPSGWHNVSVSGTVPAGTTHIAAFVWCNSEMLSSGSYWIATNMKLEVGATATEFRPRPYYEELTACRQIYDPTGAVTGDVKHAATSAVPPPPGWIPLLGSLGATDSDALFRGQMYEDLFNHCWRHMPSATVTAPPGDPQGRGSSPEEDWSNMKVLHLSDSRGRIIATQDDMGGAAANRITVAGSGINGTNIGAVGGAETHLLTANESGLRSHSHTTSFNQPSNTQVGGSNNRLSGAGSSVAIGTSGAGPANAAAAHNNMPPVIVFPLFIKL